MSTFLSHVAKNHQGRKQALCGWIRELVDTHLRGVLDGSTVVAAEVERVLGELRGPVEPGAATADLAEAITDAASHRGGERGTRPEAAAPRDQRVLFFLANPMTTSRQALDEEIHEIEDQIGLATHREAFELSFAHAPRPRDLQRRLLADGPSIVHFSGHGAPARGLVMHDTNESEQLVSGKALGRLFGAFAHDIRLVVLNACFSQKPAEHIARSVDFVVGTRREIGDVAARCFSAAFYGSLAHGRTVQESFDLGVNAVELMGLRDSEVLRLIVREGADPHRPLVAPPR